MSYVYKQTFTINFITGTLVFLEEIRLFVQHIDTNNLNPCHALKSIKYIFFSYCLILIMRRIKWYELIMSTWNTRVLPCKIWRTQELPCKAPWNPAKALPWTQWGHYIFLWRLTPFPSLQNPGSFCAQVPVLFKYRKHAFSITLVYIFKNS